MTGLVRKALAFAAGLTVVATVASAGVPDPRNSTAEPVIVGNATGNPLGAPGGFGTSAVPGYEVVVRDINNTALAGRPVVLDFSGAATIRLYAAQIAGTTIACAAKTLTKLTNGAGLALFTPKFGRFDNGTNVEVSADGVSLALVRARSTDIDGSDGDTGLADLGAFSNNLLFNTSAQETDYDLNGTTGLGDLGIFSAELLNPDPAEAYCP